MDSTKKCSIEDGVPSIHRPHVFDPSKTDDISVVCPDWGWPDPHELMYNLTISALNKIIVNKKNKQEKLTNK